MSHENERARALEAAAVDSAHLALKSLLLLNGGACVALLGFLATVIDKAPLSDGSGHLIRASVDSLGFFAWGAGFAVLAAGAAYLTNSLYAGDALIRTRPSLWRAGQYVNWLSAILALVSFGMFSAGVSVVQGIF